MKITRLGLLVILLGVFSSAFADRDAEREAEKLLEVIGMRDSLQHTITMMIDAQLQQAPALQPYKHVMLEFMGKYMDYERLKPSMVRIYAKHFTAAELREINAFYATDVGRKTIEKMPELMAEGAQLGVADVQANIGELQAMIEAESRRLEQLQGR